MSERVRSFLKGFAYSEIFRRFAPTPDTYFMGAALPDNRRNFSFIVKVGLEQIDRATGKRRISKLNLIDLAGNDSLFVLYLHSPEAIYM